MAKKTPLRIAERDRHKTPAPVPPRASAAQARTMLTARRGEDGRAEDRRRAIRDLALRLYIAQVEGDARAYPGNGDKALAKRRRRLIDIRSEAALCITDATYVIDLFDVILPTPPLTAEQRDAVPIPVPWERIATSRKADRRGPTTKRRA